jgi:hypothetical protein
VLFISTRLTVLDLSKLAVAGGDGFLAMPFSLTEVRQAVNRLLGLPSTGLNNLSQNSPDDL